MRAVSIDDLLDRPVQEGARVQALALLDAAVKERGRLGDPDDAEAVHDFRVALRRLRSLLKAHRPHLGKKVEKLRKELGDIADLTGGARDAEVQLEWLGQQRQGLSAARRPALDWLAALLLEKKEQGYGAVRTRAAADLDALLPSARQRLARFKRDISADDGPTLAAALAGLLVEHADGLRKRLGEVHSPADETIAHEARILGKQLRYLLEPLVESEQVGAAAKTTVKSLKGLQDVLGELHDAHVLGHVVQQAIIDAAAERARRLGAAVFDGEDLKKARDLRPGLVAVAEKVRDRRDGLYRDLVERGGDVAALVDAVGALARKLGDPAKDVEIERKYLLRAMPAVDGAEKLEIEQGYLPGERLKERLRRMRGPDGVERLIRGMKLGTGVRRTEVEEECPAELFEKLWPLTLGRRIAKTRYRIKDGDLVWEIDRFKGRDLLLAEVELPTEATEVVPPGWLAGAIVRDVTGEKEFTNEALASVAPAKRATARAVAKPRPKRRR